jgi:hypothetical protein
MEHAVEQQHRLAVTVEESDPVQRVDDGVGQQLRLGFYCEALVGSPQPIRAGGITMTFRPSSSPMAAASNFV